MRQDLKDLVLEIAGLIWERRLSDTAGGNVSVRDGDAICITPRLMGYRLRWQITEKDLSIVTPDGKVLEGPDQITREGLMHLGLYREFPDAGAIIHAHPYWTTVFVARAQPIVPMLETTGKFGTIKLRPGSPRLLRRAGRKRHHPFQVEARPMGKDAAHDDPAPARYRGDGQRHERLF